ncbi:ABC transporter permease [Amycolatopsis sp. K13G38]|uniref:ABC transporter permease n=1 Tax=Amycolatopsis acididurans TaxID=2724524 RepID=A0ABX1J8M8_9PSEU|nr:ABC transporter permease [Amycolatopsis acididurans]NKQ54736.1 ABC transporter permease [Amycolatopsis acididurans]
MIGRVVLDTLVTGLPLVPVFLGIYTVFRVRADFDLTVEGSFALGGAVTAIAAVSGLPPLAALPLGALAGGVAGLVTAGLHLWLRVPVLLAGLVMSIGLFSVTLHVLGAPTLSLLVADTLSAEASGYAGSPDLAISVLLGLIVLVVLAGYALLMRTEIGLALRASGVNAGMARSQGVNDRAVLALALFLSNALAGLGAGLLVQTQGYADVNMGVGIFVAGVGAVLLGELLLRPSGSKVLRIVACVLAGTLLYRLILVGALRIGLPAGDLRGVTALTLVIAVAAERYLGGALRKVRVAGLVSTVRRAS